MNNGLGFCLHLPHKHWFIREIILDALQKRHDVMIVIDQRSLINCGIFTRDFLQQLRVQRSERLSFLLQ